MIYLYVKLLQLTGLFITILFIIFPAAFCNLCVSLQNKYNSAWCSTSDVSLFMKIILYPLNVWISFFIMIYVTSRMNQCITRITICNDIQRRSHSAYTYSYICLRKIFIASLALQNIVVCVLRIVRAYVLKQFALIFKQLFVAICVE